MLREIRSKFKNFQALFITNPVNIYYLTGFTGSKAKILITKKNAYFFTDFRYLEYAKTIVPKEFRVVEINKKWKEDWPRIIKKYRIKSLGIEENHLTLKQFLELKKISGGTSLKKSDFIIENIRKIKNEEELRLIKKSQEINEKILKDVKKYIKTGVSEKEIEWFIIERIHKYKADAPSFKPVVAFGDHSSVPHHQNTDRKLKKGDVVLIDMGVKYKHYCSDMTRTFFTKQPENEEKKVYLTVLEAQNAAIDKLKKSVKLNSVNKAAINIIEKAGYLKNFQHALGHGVGLDIHELPNLGSEKIFEFEENMVTTIEPGIYLQKNFGVRIEDMLIIERTGALNITKAKKDLKSAILNI
jgi:Xaa-Pro aminopeptidase